MTTKIFPYKGYYSCESQCQIEVHHFPDFDLVICTELEDNHGTSITNMVEYLAHQVCQAENIHPDRLVWVEHYPLRGTTFRIPATWDVVTFVPQPHDGFWDNSIWGPRLGKPEWRPIKEGDVEQLRQGVNVCTTS